MWLNAIRILFSALLGMLLCTLLSGCKQDPYLLGIVGYNYTDRAIAYFSVDGAGGGNVFLSTPTSGGGGTVCCVALGRDAKTPFSVEVKYRMDALEVYPPRRLIEPAGPYKTQRVEVTGTIPPDPAYLEIHFYPDGHIEAAISGRDGPSPPRLKLESRFTYTR